MNEIIAEATGLPLRFADPRAETYARAQEFRRLSPDRRWQEIAAVMEFGLAMVRSSPRREAIQRSWEADEADWRRIQQSLLVPVKSSIEKPSSLVV
jgi:hypothetical protein